MLVTLPMLTEALQNSHIQIEGIRFKSRDNVSRVRIAEKTEDVENPEPGVLYLFRGSENCEIVCRTASGSSFRIKTDIFSFLNQVLSAFDSLNNWQRRLSEAIENGCTLTELLQLGAPVLHHPMVILDSNEWEIAHTGSPAENDFNEDWADMISSHSSRVDKIAEFNRQFYQCFQLKNVYRIPGEIFGSGFACNLFHEDRFNGVILMAEPDAKDLVTQGEKDALLILAGMIDDMIALHSYDMGTRLSEETLTKFLSEEAEEIPEKLERQLKASGWKPGDPKQIVYAEAVHFGSLTPVPSHSRQIFNRIDGIVPVVYQTGLLFLCNLRILNGREQAGSMLSDYLKQITYYGGASSVFSDLSVIRKMLQQARTAQEYGIPVSGYIWPFEKAVPAYLTAQLKKIDNGTLQHPGLVLLKNYDKRFGSHLYETFFVYLKNERRVSRAMKELDIPRSTLQNRLNRIYDILDIDLEQPEERLYLLLSYLFDQ